MKNLMFFLEINFTGQLVLIPGQFLDPDFAAEQREINPNDLNPLPFSLKEKGCRGWGYYKLKQEEGEWTGILTRNTGRKKWTIAWYLFSP